MGKARWAAVSAAVGLVATSVLSAGAAAARPAGTVAPKPHAARALARAHRSSPAAASTVTASATVIGTTSGTDAIGDELGGDAAADVTAWKVRYFGNTLRLSLDTAGYSDLLHDPRWVVGVSAVLFWIDVNGDNTEDFLVAGGYIGSGLAGFVVQNPSILPWTPRCSATLAWNGLRHFELAVAPKCLGNLPRLRVYAQMYIDEDPTGTSGASSTDFAPNTLWSDWVRPVPPVMSVGSAGAVEGASASRLLRIPVTLSQVAATPVTVSYATAGSTATSGVDFTAASGLLTIPAGALSRSISVSVKGDTTVEPTETFTVHLSAPTGATLGRATGAGTILNDDPSSAFTVSIGSSSVVEGTSGTRTAYFTVSLSARSALPVTVDYATAAGTAGAGTDFVAGSGSVTIPAGSTSAVVSIGVKGDSAVEPTEAFTVGLSNPSGAVIGRGTGTGTIFDDD